MTDEMRSRGGERKPERTDRHRFSGRLDEAGVKVRALGAGAVAAALTTATHSLGGDARRLGPIAAYLCAVEGTAAGRTGLVQRSTQRRRGGDDEGGEEQLGEGAAEPIRGVDVTQHGSDFVSNATVLQAMASRNDSPHRRPRHGLAPFHGPGHGVRPMMRPA